MIKRRVDILEEKVKAREQKLKKLALAASGRQGNSPRQTARKLDTIDWTRAELSGARGSADQKVAVAALDRFAVKERIRMMDRLKKRVGKTAKLYEDAFNMKVQLDTNMSQCNVKKTNFGK